MSDPGYNVVYHVATLNHWREVVRGQMQLLARNRFWKSLAVSVASNEAATVDEAATIIRGQMPKGEVRFVRSQLETFEHAAMKMVDDVARDGLPVLYFHAKGVSYSPANPYAETWRKYLNRIVTDADEVARNLTRSKHDACGQLMVEDPTHGFTYFAGNFWMAKGTYLMNLPGYVEFAKSGVAGHQPFDRHLAELSVNRTRTIRAFAIDGTRLTPEGVCPYLYKTCVLPLGQR
jgi:hypothetical protein